MLSLTPGSQLEVGLWVGDESERGGRGERGREGGKKERKRRKREGGR